MNAPVATIRPLVRTGALLALLLLGACTDWNEKRSDFATYAEFSASPIASNGLLPANLVPRSARNIRVIYNMDSTEVQAQFDFAAEDEAMLESPFLSPGQILFRQLVKEGQAAPPAPPESNSLIRCGSRAVEFLQLEHHGHARYWTSVDRQVHQRTCPHTFTGASQA
jgi:hypothetical protein